MDGCTQHWWINVRWMNECTQHNELMCDGWMDRWFKKKYIYTIHISVSPQPHPAILAHENLTSADMKTLHQWCAVLRKYLHELDQAFSSIRCAHPASLLALACWRQEVQQQKNGGHLTVPLCRMPLYRIRIDTIEMSHFLVSVTPYRS